MTRIRNELLNLKEVDIYSLILFALFKLREIPDYLILSELVYVLDKTSLLKLCEYFGGQTIQIPTIKELESIVYSLLLYQYIDIQNIEYEEAIKLLNQKVKDLDNIKKDYEKLKVVLQKYSFNRNENE